MGKANLATTILGKLTGKTIAGLLAFALLLVTTLLGIAVFRGSAVDLWGFKIEPRQDGPETACDCRAGPAVSGL